MDIAHFAIYIYADLITNSKNKYSFALFFNAMNFMIKRTCS